MDILFLQKQCTVCGNMLFHIYPSLLLLLFPWMRTIHKLLKRKRKKPHLYFPDISCCLTQWKKTFLYKCHPKAVWVLWNCHRRTNICVYCLCFVYSNKVYWGGGRAHRIMLSCWTGWYVDARHKIERKANTTYEPGTNLQKRDLCKLPVSLPFQGFHWMGDRSDRNGKHKALSWSHWDL